MAGKKDPNGRRRLKFEEMLKQNALGIIGSSNKESSTQAFTPSLTQRYTTYCINKEGVTYKFMVPITLYRVDDNNAASSSYYSSLSYYVERSLEDFMKGEIIFEKVRETVQDKIKLHAGSLVRNKFPIVEIDMEDQQDEEHEDAIGDYKREERIQYHSKHVARFVEAHVGMMATHVNKTIRGYYKPASIDVAGVIGLVSLAICDIVTEKMGAIIYGTLFETVMAYYKNNFDIAYISNSHINDLQEESSHVADLIVDATCLVVDDAITALIADGFKNTCDSPGILKISDSSGTIIESVAKKISEMQI